MVLTLIFIVGLYYLTMKGNMLNPVYLFQNSLSFLATFLIAGNMLGVLPFIKAPASDLKIAMSLAGVVMFAIIIIKLYKQRQNYITNFMPESNLYMLIPILMLEIIAYLNRCLSLGLRIFINLAAGKFMTHVILEIAGDSLIVLSSLGLFLSFEIMVAYLQYYIFCYISKIS